MFSMVDIIKNPRDTFLKFIINKNIIINNIKVFINNTPPILPSEPYNFSDVIQSGLSFSSFFDANNPQPKSAIKNIKYKNIQITVLNIGMAISLKLTFSNILELNSKKPIDKGKDSRLKVPFLKLIAFDIAEKLNILCISVSFILI